jgi:hypothetical protein
VELPKERWEVHADGQTAICDNFRTTTLPGGKKIRGLNQDKGQANAVESFCRALSEGLGPVMSIQESVGATLASLATLTSMASVEMVRIGRVRSSSSDELA